MKKCKTCQWIKPVDDFYSTGGNKCKKCTCASVRENRKKNAAHYKSYESGRAANPDRVEARAKYAQTEAGKAVHSKAKKLWTRKNPTKRQAINMVNNAVRDGKLFKPENCENCLSSGRISGHHDDYAKPLDVRWLCDPCHNAWHNINGEAKNGHYLDKQLKA